MRVFKVFRAEEWQQAECAGRFEGSADDRRDGYIHLSLAHQLAGVLARYFAGARDLQLAVFPADALGEALRFEPSTGGDLYPHFYGALPLGALEMVIPIDIGPEGRHILPPIAQQDR